MTPWHFSPSVPLISPCGNSPAIANAEVLLPEVRLSPRSLLITLTRPPPQVLLFQTCSVFLSLVQYQGWFLALFRSSSRTGLLSFSWFSWILGFYLWFLDSMSPVSPWAAPEPCTCLPDFCPVLVAETSQNCLSGGWTGLHITVKGYFLSLDSDKPQPQLACPSEITLGFWPFNTIMTESLKLRGWLDMREEEVLIPIF